MLSKSCSAPALGSLMISAPHSEALRGGSDVDFSPPIWTPWKLICKSPRCARFSPRCLDPKDGGLEGRLPGSQRFRRAQSENNLVHSRLDRMACYPNLDEVTEEESDDLEVSDNPAESAVPNYHNSMPNTQIQLAENSSNSIPNAQIQLAEKSLLNIQTQSWGSHSMQKSYRESINDEKRGIMQPIHMIIATVDCGKDGNLSIPGRVSRNSAMADGAMYSIVGAGSNGGSKARHVSEAELEDGLGNGKGGGKGMPVCGGGGGGGGSGAESNKTDIYYQKMLEANPGNPLLLRNYAKFLHEVQHDMRKAEEYYGRAILASPGDGDVLSLYARLIWEGHQDPSRAKAYFDRAVRAAPDDCYVLASYAHFLWNSKDEEEEEEDPDPRYNVLGQSFVGSASVATC